MALCPCSRKCCDNPEPSGLIHECSEEAVCEDCSATLCVNCGEICYCEL